jgi:hypothetical protein
MWNWAGTIAIKPASLLQPTSVDDVRQLVAKRGAARNCWPVSRKRAYDSWLLRSRIPMCPLRVEWTAY